MVATNLAGIHHDGRIDGWATLHPELLGDWIKGREVGRMFAPACVDSVDVEVVPERWPGSSGLYAVQCALFEMGASGAILCGLPMDSEAGHIIRPGPWGPVGTYRQAFVSALPLIGGRVRSMSGWTCEVFGAPKPDWIGAIGRARPASPATPQRRRPMFEVKNVSDRSQRFNEADPNGGYRQIILAPGEIGTFDIDPAQARFQRGELKVTPVREKTRRASPAPSRKPEARPLKPEPGAPLPEASEEA